MREKSSFATHQGKEHYMGRRGCQIIGGPFEKMNSYHTWKCLIKSGSYVLNYKRNIFSLFQIFDACVQAEKVLVYYLICYVEVDGLRNKTKYESSRSPEQWFTQFFGFTQKPTTTNITTTGMLKCIKKFAWIVCISNKKILTHELTAFFYFRIYI